jgi:uncharacterized protein YbjQ (UPF0145 family)
LSQTSAGVSSSTTGNGRVRSELPILTEATDRARWNAMARMQAEADALQANGVVGVGFEISNYAWGLHTVEFYAAGTAVRRTGSGETITPSFVLPVSM